MMQEQQAIIHEKKVKLETARKNLKNYFTGIDEVIDEVIAKIETWWCHPDFLTRPTIINLWGLTGHGKTDLVRRLAAELGMSDNFCSIEMDNSKLDPYISTNGPHSDFSILGRFYNNKIQPSTQAIILLDDIHRYHTIEGDMSIDRTQYDDVWKLLSDGRLIDDRTRIVFLQGVLDSLRNFTFEKFDTSKESANAQNTLLLISHMSPEAQKAYLDMSKANRPKFRWPVDRFLNTIGLTDEERIWLSNMNMMTSDPEDYLTNVYKISQMERNADAALMKSLNDDVLAMYLRSKLEDVQNQDSYDPESYVYSKLLIFISGNLDDIFHPPKKNAAESLDIEELYKHTKSVTVTMVKESLLKLFRPEQVARFGNNHVIYPSMREISFKEIVSRGVQRAEDRLKEKYGIIVQIDREHVYQCVKEFGIFPAQGVRPIFSATDSVLANVIPQILIKSQSSGNAVITYPFEE